MGDDLPAIEPVKIYENTYQKEPFEQEKCAAPAKARASGRVVGCGRACTAHVVRLAV